MSPRALTDLSVQVVFVAKPHVPKQVTEGKTFRAKMGLVDIEPVLLTDAEFARHNLNLYTISA